jgi:predicted hotdog family 3-hydroxylacyl-ACP dehydratase
MTWARVADLLPQRGPMCLLSEVLAHDPQRTVCRARVADAHLFHDEDGAAPAWLALEYAAQCTAVHGSLSARSGGGALRPALLLGTRRMHLSVPRFTPGATLQICARHHRGETGLVAFDCSVEDPSDGRVLASGRVNVYTLDEDASLPGVDDA